MVEPLVHFAHNVHTCIHAALALCSMAMLLEGQLSILPSSWYGRFKASA